MTQPSRVEWDSFASERNTIRHTQREGDDDKRKKGLKERGRDNRGGGEGGVGCAEVCTRWLGRSNQIRDPTAAAIAQPTHRQQAMGTSY